MFESARVSEKIPNRVAHCKSSSTSEKHPTILENTWHPRERAANTQKTLYESRDSPNSIGCSISDGFLRHQQQTQKEQKRRRKKLFRWNFFFLLVSPLRFTVIVVVVFSPWTEWSRSSRRAKCKVLEKPRRLNLIFFTIHKLLFLDFLIIKWFSLHVQTCTQAVYFFLCFFFSVSLKILFFSLVRRWFLFSMKKIFFHSIFFFVSRLGHREEPLIAKRSWHSFTWLSAHTVFLCCVTFTFSSLTRSSLLSYRFQSQIINKFSMQNITYIFDNVPREDDDQQRSSLVEPSRSTETLLAIMCEQQPAALSYEWET